MKSVFHVVKNHHKMLLLLVRISVFYANCFWLSDIVCSQMQEGRSGVSFEYLPSDETVLCLDRYTPDQKKAMIAQYKRTMLSFLQSTLQRIHERQERIKEEQVEVDAQLVQMSGRTKRHKSRLAE